jgi:hypothetical protein
VTISRRRFFVRSAAVVGGVGLLGMAAARAQQTKVAKSAVAYQDTPSEGHSCASCSLFEPPNACKAVDGDITPSGWCKLWAPKS